MLPLIVLIYVLYRVLATFLVQRDVNSTYRPTKKIFTLLLLEVILVISGVAGVMVLFADPGPASQLGQHKVLQYTMLILGTVCLIASGRVGMYTRKLSRGEFVQNTGIPNGVGSISKNKTRNFLYLAIMLWILGATFSALDIVSALLYAAAMIVAATSFIYAKRLKADSTQRKSAFGFMFLSGFITLFSFLSTVSVFSK